MDIQPFTGGASTVGKMSVALPMTLSHYLTQNLTRGFAQLAVVRISWWVLLLRKLAGVMGHGSLQLAIAPRAFPGGGLVFSACLAEACGCVMVDSVLGKGAVILGKCRRCSARGWLPARTGSAPTLLRRGLSGCAASQGRVFSSPALGTRCAAQLPGSSSGTVPLGVLSAAPIPARAKTF